MPPRKDRDITPEERARLKRTLIKAVNKTDDFWLLQHDLDDSSIRHQAVEYAVSRMPASAQEDARDTIYGTPEYNAMDVMMYGCCIIRVDGEYHLILREDIDPSKVIVPTKTTR